MFDPYIDKYRGPYNPRGIFVYKIRDLEADLLYKQGLRIEALRVAKLNYEEAKENEYVITSSKSRGYITREELLKNLHYKVKCYEKN